jgi:osmoprotectant transport system ATP-binding protein
MIAIHDLTKSLGNKFVLNGLSLDIPDGQTVALLGISGSGKTTLLKCLCGLLRPDHGTIKFSSLALTAETRKTIRQSLGYVIQDGGLFPHLTLLENIELIGREARMSEKAISLKTEELASLVKLPVELLKRYPRQVSGGQRQRIGLMRALFLNPSYLFLDEPLGSLDPITRFELQMELKETFSRLKKTVILVTHDLAEARRLSERIVVLNEGRIAQDGSMKELVERPASEFVRRFLESQDAL